MRHLGHPLVPLLLMAGCALSLRGDQCEGRSEKLIIYLGSQPLDLDVSYGLFKKALAAEPKADCVNYFLTHVTASGDDESSASAALKKAADQKPSLMVAPNAWVAKMAFNKLVGKNTPVVFYSQTNLEEEGFDRNISTQDPPTTGVTLYDNLDGKRLSILHEAFPSVRHVGVVSDDFWLRSRNDDGRLSAVAASLGMELSTWVVESKLDMKRVQDESGRFDIDAWYIPPTYAVAVARDEIIQFTKQKRAPAIYSYKTDIESGALMAYYQVTSFIFPSLANLTLRVCGGERPGSIPVETPRQFLLSIRSRYDLGGLRISPSVLGQADLIVP